ncbi:MAG: heavy metal-responsive transcriptional regulator [Gemmatimonadales bacterium]
MPLKIGQVASGAGVNIQTVRYYERRGLLPEALRTPAGYRTYGDEAIARLRFIKRAQDLGFSLGEITELLELRVQHGAACETVEAKAKEKIAMVERKIGELERMKSVLVELSRACDLREPTADCPILEMLGDDT